MKRILKGLFLVLLALISNQIMSQVTYQNNIFQVGKSVYTPMYIGENWAIEDWEGGLNFWKPFPTENWGNYKLFLDKSNRVGIGRVPTSHLLEVAGNVWASGIFVTSDERLKTNIKDLDAITCLDRLTTLKAKSYNKYFSPTIESEMDILKMVQAGKLKPTDSFVSPQRPLLDTRTQFGFMAQDFKDVFPELVDENEGILSIDYTSLIPVIIEGMKELRSLIDEKNEKINYLESILHSMSDFSTTPQTRASNAFLYQPASTPYYYQLTIKFNLPDTYTSASITIYNANGTKLKEYHVAKGETYITIQPSSLTAGIYISTLVVDGNLADSKKMVLTN